jgi:hypothetical protein
MSGMKDPLNSEQLETIVIEQQDEFHGSFIFTHEHARACLDSLGIWVINGLKRQTVDDNFALTNSFAQLFVQVADGVSRIVAGCNQNNVTREDLPPVLPHQISKIDMRQLAKIVQRCLERLRTRFDPEYICKIS